MSRSHHASSTSQADGSLTFGVELKFFAAYWGDYESLDQSTGRHYLPADQGEAFEAIAREIQTAVRNEYRVYPQRPSGSSAAANDYTFYKTYWTVKKHEGDMEPDRDDVRVGRGWHDVEVTSPIMKLRDLSKTLPRVMRQLNTKFRLSLNESCAFQVHIGHGQYGFSPQTRELTIKKLATILWLAEARLDRLYRPDRIGEKWAVALSKCHINLAQEYKENRPLARRQPYLDWLQSIINRRIQDGSISVTRANQIQALWDEPDFNTLCGTMLAPRTGGKNGAYFSYCAAYSFFNLVSSRDEAPLKYTIEFRRPEGTLDPGVAVAWCRVFAAIVEYARRSSKESFQAVIGNLLLPEARYPLATFLQNVGCVAADYQPLFDKESSSAFNMTQVGNALPSTGSGSGFGSNQGGYYYQ
ncbi:hypothetical protein QBC43DRAFT_283567 [Cladorrhinum sp. PSN259]|nr:hypothetical protein QBC43DRAFT_283567 [Cladorrhinum sp. PSN259]